MKSFFYRHIERETSIAPLIIFRIVFGLVMLAGTVRFWLNGWIEKLYIQPQFFFSYYGFEWVHPYSPEVTYLAFGVMGGACFFIIFGFLYRYASIAFFVSFTYIELLDKTNYLNHYYFVSLIAFLLVFVPAGSSFSIDALLRKTSRSNVPSWCINIFKVQMGMLYFFAGIAKLNYDWLFRAMPLKIWLAPHTDIWLIGPLMNDPITAYVFSWGGMLFDLSIAFVLLSKKLRPLGYFSVVVFHLFTALFFQIGMFPYVMICITIIFFSPEFHQRIIDLISQVSPFDQSSLVPMGTAKLSSVKKIALSRVLVVFFVIQVALPFRYILYPGKLFWTEEGFRFSWRVMLMEKLGYAQFFITNPETGVKILVENENYLTTNQIKMMSSQPDMILQYAHFLDEEAKKNWGISDPIVTADIFVTLNGTGSRPFIDSSVDLSREKESFAHKSWILPFEQIDKTNTERTRGEAISHHN